VREPHLPPGVPNSRDDEVLAWAAGFFDGEGSTIAKGDSRRPGYRQLQVVVPQAGNGHAPQVLEKFRAAALGTGAIAAVTSNGVYSWRARGRVDAELILALMWPHLGTVKRMQAAKALELVDSQYASGAISRRQARYVPNFGVGAALAPATGDSDRLSCAWAAGFLDAEGWFGVVRGSKRKDGTTWLRIRASASQHSSDGSVPEVLTRLREIVDVGSIERHGDADDFKWVVESRASVLRVVERISPWLGDVKHAQAASALSAFDGQTRRRGSSSDVCVRGHTYDRIVVTADGKVRKHCNACARIAERARRLAQGARPRNVHAVLDDASRVYRAS
jgi:hypothetical protein